jgi:hypothetical protein
VVTGTLAGCTRLSEFVADYVVGELNLFNLSKDRLTGPVTLVDPDGETVLDEDVNLAPESGDKDGEPSILYEDVLTTAGRYELTLELDAAGPSDRAAVTAAKRLQITDPDPEKIVVFFSERWTEEFLTIQAIEDFAELEDDFED